MCFLVKCLPELGLYIRLYRNAQISAANNAVFSQTYHFKLSAICHLSIKQYIYDMCARHSSPLVQKLPTMSA